jgi:hypothetical protein
MRRGVFPGLAHAASGIAGPRRVITVGDRASYPQTQFAAGLLPLPARLPDGACLHPRSDPIASYLVPSSVSSNHVERLARLRPNDSPNALGA